MIDINDFHQVYSLGTQEQKTEMQQIVRKQLIGLDDEDFAVFKALNSDFKTVAKYGKLWFTYNLSKHHSDSEVTYFEVVLDKLSNGVYIKYAALGDLILIMRFYESNQFVTEDNIYDIEDDMVPLVQDMTISYYN